MDLFKPSQYFAWAVHIDGLRERHDESVCRDGVFDKAVAAIAEAKRRGFRVTTNTTFFTHDTPDTVRQRARLPQRRGEGRRDDDLARRTPTSGRPTRTTSSASRRRASSSARPSPTGAAKRWRLNHSPLFLDFLEGKADFDCTAWAIPELLAARLAAPVLPDGRRLREDLQGAHRDDGLGEVRARQGPALRQLHGALRLRALRGDGDEPLASPVVARAAPRLISCRVGACADPPVAACSDRPGGACTPGTRDSLGACACWSSTMR